jgi:hypothetical protein
MGITSLIKLGLPRTLQRMKPVQPLGIFGVHAFATQPPAPMPHLSSQGVQKMLKNAAVDTGG